MEEKPKRIVLDVSWYALFKVVFLVFAIWTMIFLKEILTMLFVVFIFVAAVNPTISYWQKYMSRFLAVLLFYVLFLAILLLISSTLIPLAAHQINELVRSMPDIIHRSKPLVDYLRAGNYTTLVNQAISTFSIGLTHFTNGLFNSTLNFFGGLATTLTGFVLSFYLLLEEKNARDFFLQLLPHHRYQAVYKTVNKISDRMGSWVRSQVMLMLIIGLSNLVAYLIIRLPSPVPLALWAGLCEIIPYIGPTLGLIPAFALAVVSGTPLQAILVIVIGYGIIQQIEAHIVVPKLVGKSVGLSPVLVILALLIGIQFFGFVGALISVPAAAVISVIVGEWGNLKKIWEVNENQDEKNL